MKNKKGITLIALIITIIVMLILVGVTVTVAINGGLFQKTKEAANKTQIEQEKEILTAAAIAAYDEKAGKIEKDKLIAQLNDEWTIDGEGPFTCTSPKQNRYTVSTDGEIKYCLGTELEQYILGDELKGRDFDRICDLDTKKFTNSNVEFLYLLSDNENAGLAFMYIKYDNAIYRFKISFDFDTNASTTMASEGVKEIYKPNGNEGKLLSEVTGNNDYKDWTIIYDNGDTVEAVYNYAMGEVGLGAEYEKTDFANDEEAKKEADLDNDGTVSELEKAIYSYNHSIDTINNYCKNLTGLPTNTNVRSVGARTDTPKEYYTFENVKIDEEGSNKINIKVRKPDMEYEADAARLMFYNIAKATTKGSTEESKYLFASRRTYKLDMEVDGILTKTCGCIQPFYYEGELWRSGENGLVLVTGYEGDLIVGTEKNSWNMPVRPVITVKIK